MIRRKKGNILPVTHFRINGGGARSEFWGYFFPVMRTVTVILTYLYWVILSQSSICALEVAAKLCNRGTSRCLLMIVLGSEGKLDVIM
jgi:hypothetical protein